MMERSSRYGMRFWMRLRESRALKSSEKIVLLIMKPHAMMSSHVTMGNFSQIAIQNLGLKISHVLGTNRRTVILFTGRTMKASLPMSGDVVDCVTRPKVRSPRIQMSQTQP